MRSAADTSRGCRDVFYGKIVGSKIRYFLNARNEVDRMEGAEELASRLTFSAGAKLKPGTTWDKKVLDGLLKQDGLSAQQPEHFAWLRNIFSKAYFESKIHHQFLPTHAVQPGDTWPVFHEYPIGVIRVLERVLVRDFKVTFHGWETHGVPPLRPPRIPRKRENQARTRFKSSEAGDAQHRRHLFRGGVV